jgi:putative nucleotidyltransferase with HDIG domain
MQIKPSFRTALQISCLLVLAVLTLYLLPRQTSPFKYDIVQGKPWPNGLVRAGFDFPILKTDEEMQQDVALIMQDFSPYYLLADSSVSLYVVSAAEMERLQQMQCQRISVMYNHHASHVAVSQLYTPKTAYQLTNKQILPNLTYDSIATEAYRSQLLRDISGTRGMVMAGENIVDRGEIVTPHIYQLLISLRHAYTDKEVSKSRLMQSRAGSAVCVVILLLVFYFYLFTYRKKLLDDMRNILFFSILIALMTSASFLVIQYLGSSYLYLLPFAWCPVITRVFYDSRTAIFIHLITISLVSIAVPSPYTFLLLQLLVGIVAVISLRDMTQRAQLIQTAAFVLVTYIVLYTALELVHTTEIAYNEWKTYYPYICFVINAVLVICSYGLIFLFERTFGLLSNITLVELTNVNSNLMLDFAEKAPGTFQHSLQVSNLATEAAKRIGAKVLLVRTGALYHDIGKMAQSECFTENQTNGINPLDGLTPQQAAQVIIGHVIEGEKIARQHRLPEMIIHFIRSHHGTSQTRYFYTTAINQALQQGLTADSVDASAFTYPGPKPTTKEAAILMMADAIEARSRSLQQITPDTISHMVDDMIDMQVSQGQLSETPLSFKDLEDVRQVFKQKLQEIYHHRITYPTVDKASPQ